MAKHYLTYHNVEDFDFEEEFYADWEVELTQTEADLVVAAREAWHAAQTMLEEKAVYRFEKEPDVDPAY